VSRRIGLRLQSKHRGVEYSVASDDLTEEIIDDIVKLFCEIPRFIDKWLDRKEDVSSE